MSFWSLRGAIDSLLRLIAFPFFLGAAVLGLLRSYLRSQPLERRQIRWVVLGGIIVAVAQLVNVAALLGRCPVHLGRASRMITQLGVPAGVLVSVLAYGWLDVDRLISATASYTLVGLAVLGGALALIPRLAHAGAPLLGLDVSTGQWALTLALIGAAIPVHQFLRPRIDRRLFAERHAAHARPRAAARRSRPCDERGGADPPAAASASMRCSRRSRSPSTPGRRRRSRRSSCAGGRRRPPSSATRRCLHTLARRARPLAADASELDAFDRAALETLGIAVVVPIRRGETIVAITCLGRKRSGDIYTPEELAHLMAVANRCSEMLRKLGDEVVIREAREMQQALRRYVPGAVADELDGGRALEAAEREVTVLFVDMRGYTSFSSSSTGMA